MIGLLGDSATACSMMVCSKIACLMMAYLTDDPGLCSLVDLDGGLLGDGLFEDTFLQGIGYEKRF
jgi:hypothetical protein